MPWGIRKSGNKWEVYNKETGGGRGKSDSHAEAVAHMKAMYAHVPEARKMAEGGEVHPLKCMCSECKAIKHMAHGGKIEGYCHMCHGGYM